MSGFRHEALLYEGEQGFYDQVLPFLREGLSAREPTLVVVSADRIRSLRSALGADADEIQFADMDAVGQNPARIIPSLQRFVDAHAGDGRRIRGVGEPFSARRGPSELEECELHEELLNVAFADSGAWWLVCPYDVETLGADLIERARRNHPFVWSESGHVRSEEYPHGAFGWPDADSLTEPPAVSRAVVFDQRASLRQIRTFVDDVATGAGMTLERREELVLAVHEMITNSIRHGGGHGVLRAWRDGEALVCEVRDAGRIRDPLVGRRRPEATRTGGRGLWIANQLCDLVQIRESQSGVVVRAHMRVDR